MRFLILFLLSFPVFGQVTTFNTKPISSIWNPADIQSAEVRLRGRLSTDPTTTHKIIARIPVKLDWTVVLAPRVTVLVPAGQSWEVKSVVLFVTPTVATGVASVEVISRTLAVPHQAPSGQMLAMDVNLTTGVIMLGPVASTPQPPAPPAVTIGSNITDGAVIKGSLIWTATSSVVPLRVEFFVDGASSPPESISPYQYNGDPDGRLDTLKMANGTHKLLIKVFLKDGTSHTREIAVTVQN